MTISSTDLDTLIAEMEQGEYPEISIANSVIAEAAKALTDLRTERDAAASLVSALFAALDGDGISREYGTFQGGKTATIGGIAAFTADWDAVSTAPHMGKRWEEMTTQERFESAKFSAQHALIKELANLRAIAPTTALADRDARILEEAADEWHEPHDPSTYAVGDWLTARAVSRRREASPQEDGVTE